MLYDLHCHTTASDGQLTPTELIARAETHAVTCLAVTDHDTIAAYRELSESARTLTLIAGIELSTHWRGVNVHIVGLNFDLTSSAMETAVNSQLLAREARAEAISVNLEKYGFKHTLEGAKAIAGDSAIGRPHFAQHLVETGQVGNIKQAFKRYLGAGKAGDVKQHWASLPQIVRWIKDAGGIAVLAHPAKYKLTFTKLGELCDDFIAAGGEGFEVCSGRQLPNVTRSLARLCEQKQLLASCGSDFHGPGQPWAELGNYSPLPERCTPVWEAF